MKQSIYYYSSLVYFIYKFPISVLDVAEEFYTLEQYHQWESYNIFSDIRTLIHTSIEDAKK